MLVEAVPPVAGTTGAGGPLGAVLAIMRVARALERVDAGLSPQQYRILKLAGAGGERSARLAERLAVAKPTLTAIADSLVAAGLARREAEPGDRRVVRLQLTEAGTPPWRGPTRPTAAGWARCWTRPATASGSPPTWPG